jgi:hypothetical protein
MIEKKYFEAKTQVTNPRSRSTDFLIFNRGFFGIFMYFIQQGFICRPSDSAVSEDAGIGIGSLTL